MLKPSLLIAFSTGILLIGCAKKEVPSTQQSAQTAKEAAPSPKPEPSGGIPTVVGDTVTTPSGLKYIEVVAGQGASPTLGQIVSAHYTGWLADGTKFDSSRDRGQPLDFPLGGHRVIQGWEEGLGSMKVGGRRMLIIPSNLGWGERGTPGGPIPPGATTVFDVELVAAANPPAKP